MKRRDTPLATAVKGLVAGAVGSATMTAYQVAVQKARGGGGSSTPAEVGKRVIEGVFQREVPDRWTGALNNATHFLYGSSWGPAYAIAHASNGGGALRGGLKLGVTAWSVSLVELPLMRLAPPVWQYPPEEVALDLSYHLVYGLGVAGAFAVLQR